MSEPAACDALFVVHRLIRVAELAAAGRACGARRIAVLTTHQPFFHEQAEISAALAPATVTFSRFAEFLGDEALAGLDDSTTEALRHAPPSRLDYTDVFQRSMTRRKNAAVHAGLGRIGPIRRIYAAHGLGIDGPYWREHGATLFETPRPLESLQSSALWRRCRAWLDPIRDSALWHRLRPRRAPHSSTGTVVHDGAIGYVFVAGLHRLRLREGSVVKTMPLATALADPTVRFVGTTLHDDPPSAHHLGLPVRVFVDGYLPTNYPRTYIDALSDSEFICAEPFSAQWLSRHGRPTLPAPDFIDPGLFAQAVLPCSVRTVVCLLNHAGDWSALIHRSDTDILAEAFVQLARLHPSLHLVLRPHPGMENPRHEGPGGLARLDELVRTTAAPNLEFSRAPLADDLTRADIFISEYSATLLEAWRTGKLGLIANLTGRRSFLQDFTDLGFPSVTTAAELHSALLSVAADPATYAARQSAAATRYNALLTS